MGGLFPLRISWVLELEQVCFSMNNLGFSSIVVPGSGVPFYDSFEVNPFETKKQKREKLVHQLLEKLPP